MPKRIVPLHGCNDDSVLKTEQKGFEQRGPSRFSIHARRRNSPFWSTGEYNMRSGNNIRNLLVLMDQRALSETKKPSHGSMVMRLMTPAQIALLKMVRTGL